MGFKVLLFSGGRANRNSTNGNVAKSMRQRSAGHASGMFHPPT